MAFAQGKIKDDPVIPDGYQLIPDTLVNGFNELIGVRYQHYTLKKTHAQPRGCPKEAPKRDKKCKKREHIWDSIKRLFKRRS